MLADLSQDELLPRLQTLVYLLASVAIGILMYDQYRQGLYPLVLTNAIAIPAFVFSAIFIYINRDRDSFSWVNYPLIFTLAALALYQLPQYPQLMTHYLYALPLFSYFCLPLYPATVFNVVVAAYRHQLFIAARFGLVFRLSDTVKRLVVKTSGTD